MTFQIEMNKVAREIRHELEKHFRRIALVAYQRINEHSPVDQGTFRANWNVTVDTIDRSFDLSLKKEDFAERANVVSSVIMNEAKLGTTVVISNSVPYATRLENGYSMQHPEGILEPTVDSIVQEIEK